MPRPRVKPSTARTHRAAPPPSLPRPAPCRCLVRDGDTEAPSFLFESVVNGDQQGRYSFVGAMPAKEVG